MCCSRNTKVCCNPLKKTNHNRSIDVLPINRYEREQYWSYLEDATHICSLCRLQLTQTVPEDQLDDYLLLVDVLNEMTEFVGAQQHVNNERSDAIRELQQQLRSMAEERTSSNNNPSEKPPLSGIDMLLAAAEFVEGNDANLGTTNSFHVRQSPHRTDRSSS